MPFTLNWSVRRWIFTIAGLLWVGVLAWVTLQMFTPHYRVSHASTFVTGPLNPDGTVNFAAAINAVNSRGVTPQNNAAVAVLKIMGADALDGGAAARTAGLAAMGISKLPQAGPFRAFWAYLKAVHFGQPAGQPRPVTEMARQRLHYELLAASQAELNRYNAINKPWTPAEHPLVARWLASQRHVISMVRTAARLPRYFVPLYASKGSGIFTSIFSLSRVEMLQDLLRIDALEKMGTGKSAHAWRDIVAIRQLGLLVRQQRPTLIGLFISMGGEERADGLTVQLAQSGISSESQLRSWLAESRKWQIVGGLRDSINWGDRLEELSITQGLFQRQNRIAAKHYGFRGIIPLHFGQSMAQYNRWVNRIVGALRPAAYAARRRAIKQQTARINAESPHGWRGILAHLNVLHNLLTQMMPDFSRALTVEYAARARQSLAQVALALAAYHVKKGRYPASLVRLVPHYFPVVPTDPFTDHPLHYSGSQTGYLLYSVGPNLRDDHGYCAPQSYPPIPNAPDDIGIHLHWQVAPPGATNGAPAGRPQQ